jgi:hypothetical protein
MFRVTVSGPREAGAGGVVLHRGRVAGPGRADTEEVTGSNLSRAHYTRLSRAFAGAGYRGLGAGGAGHCCILGSCVGSAYMGGQP